MVAVIYFSIILKNKAYCASKTKARKNDLIGFEKRLFVKGYISVTMENFLNTYLESRNHFSRPYIITDRESIKLNFMVHFYT